MPPHPPVVVERRADGVLEAHARGVTLSVGRAPDAFRSVELLLAALGTCMLGTMLTYAETAAIEIASASVELYPLVGGSPERVERIDVTLRVEGDIPGRRRAALARAAGKCKVHETLRRAPEIAVVVV